MTTEDSLCNLRSHGIAVPVSLDRAWSGEEQLELPFADSLNLRIPDRASRALSQKDCLLQVDEKAPEESDRIEFMGWICPSCGRGIRQDVKFCDHGAGE